MHAPPIPMIYSKENKINEIQYQSKDYMWEQMLFLLYKNDIRSVAYNSIKLY